MRVAAALLLLGLPGGACKYEPARAQLPDDAQPGDGTPPVEDGPPDDGSMTVTDAPPAEQCYGTFVSICLPAPLPTQQRVVDNLAIDTDTATECATLAMGSFDACAIVGTNVIVDGAITAIGSRPLVLLATDGTVTINGNALVDVASHRIGNVRGAAANPAGCTGTDPTGGGGGFGGSGGGAGGNGGGAAGASTGGIADAALAKPTTLVGGCPGSQGGGNGGAGGNGGGALALIATTDIVINGKVDASGAGGSGGLQSDMRNGGGGGGSGGLIVFDPGNTLTLNGSADVIAQGGGGGEGSSNMAAGAPGSDPTTRNAPALGGTGNPGGNGGFGGVVAGGTNGDTGGGVNGGGGGGGGTGFILSTKGALASAQASPAIQGTP